MGVVRRDGNWRLEKIDDGLYEVTYDGAAEATITTPEYSPDVFEEPYTLGVPTHEVESFAEAEEVFARMTANDQTGPMSTSVSLTSSGDSTGPGFDSSTSSGGELEDIEALPPGGIALVLLVTGGIITNSSPVAVGSIPFYVGLVMLIGGTAIIGWSVIILKNHGSREMWTFLTTTEDTDDEGSTNTSEDDSERTPPTPQSLKDELYFDRADQQCEWCDERTDQPEVHHIEPRIEGGPNEPSNLIVLCPGCHAKADRGAISKTKLRAKVRRVNESTIS